MFENIIGNEGIKQYLERLVERRSLANSLLFTGPEGIGKSLFAQGIAQALLGASVHPDLHIYKPEGKLGMHAIDSMRLFSEEVYMAPFQGSHKIFIIHDADRMLPSSANALLKTFEEPPLDSIIILISSVPSLLLPTILSRCWTICFQALSNDEIVRYLQTNRKVEEAEARRLAFLSGGSIGNALRWMEQGSDGIRNLLLDFLGKGTDATYQELRTVAEAISGQIEASKKHLEGSIQSELFSGSLKNLTALQKESLEKDVEGALAMRQMQLMQSLFTVVLGWFRDIELLAINGNCAYLFNQDRKSSLEQALQRGERLLIERVQKAIVEAKLAVERSTTLSICIESLFLKIGTFC